MDRKLKEQRQRLGQLDNLYSDNSAEEKNFKEISRPSEKRLNFKWARLITLILALLVIGGSVYLVFFRNKFNLTGADKNAAWYAVTLKTNDERYYGQIKDIKANPIELKNVYYNYDQAVNKTSDKPADESGNLRLVKRGKETYGPSGSMLIYQTEIKTVDKLADDSKVLKAILEYEK